MRNHPTNSVTKRTEQALERIEARLEVILRTVKHAHNHELRKIDEESNELAARIDEIAGVTGDAEQARRLRALSVKLTAMGKVPEADEPSL